MLDLKKIRNRRKKLIKINVVNAARLENWAMLEDELRNPIDNEHRYHAWQGAIETLSDWLTLFSVDAAKTGNTSLFRAYAGLFNANFLYSIYMRKELVRIDPTRRIVAGFNFGHSLLYLQASGYSELAREEADFTICTPKLAEDHHGTVGSQTYPLNYYEQDKHDWFGLMFALSDPAQLFALGYNPTPEDLGPFWLLLNNWNDPDPTVPQNALQAAQEFLMANAVIGSDKAHHIVGNDALFWDYLPRAVNQRRAELGLAPVIIETYIDDDLVGDDVPIPFARDNLFWASQLRYCEELGIPPYEFRGPVIDVHLDPVTGILSV